MNYFRCRSADRKQELERLRMQLEKTLKPLAPQSIAVRRLPSREQCRSSQETEIIVFLSSGQNIRVRIAKPVAAINHGDLQQLHITDARTRAKE